MADSQRGAEILMDLYEVEGLVPAVDGDYDPVRRMVDALDRDIEEELRRGD